MAKIDIQLYKKYKLGLLERKLTKEEKKEIDECEFTTNLMVPVEPFKRIYQKLKEKNFEIEDIIKMLEIIFDVPEDLVMMKICDIKIEKEKMKRKYKKNC